MTYVTQTHLDNNFQDRQLLPNVNKHIYIYDRVVRDKGGVFIAISDSLKHSVVKIDIPGCLEEVVIHIPPQNNCESLTVVICVYIAPSILHVAQERLPLSLLIDDVQSKLPRPTHIFWEISFYLNINWNSGSAKDNKEGYALSLFTETRCNDF